MRSSSEASDGKPRPGGKPGKGEEAPPRSRPPASAATQLRRAEKERELYLGLLNLSEAEDPGEFVERALALIVDILGAARAYIELVDPESDSGDSTTEDSAWWTAAGCSDEEIARIRESVSRGIIAHAIAAGQVLSVPSALLDPRFRDRDSVKRSKIETVLCVPIGSEPPLGVVYLMGASSAGAFRQTEISRAETFAKHLVPLAEQFFQKHRRSSADATRALRQRLNLTTIVGRSPALARLLSELELAAPVDVSLLISGETGTGKSQIARVIHQNSARRSGPFLEINCAAIPDTLLESELFGAAAGAHSTASKKVEGKIAAATGGTLFLDEIAELSLTAQAKLLQLLQTKTYYALGSTKPQTADIRVMAATNADLPERIKTQHFREDLFYRLSVLPLRVPPLAERPEDVPLLAEHFCKLAAQKHGASGLSFSPSALASLRTRAWPGNVRELENVIEAAVLRARARNVSQVQPVHLFPAEAPPGEQEAPRTFQEETRRFQRSLLKQRLEEHDWNVSQTARDLDLARAHVYNLIKAFELERGRA